MRKRSVCSPFAHRVLDVRRGRSEKRYRALQALRFAAALCDNRAERFHARFFAQRLVRGYVVRANVLQNCFWAKAPEFGGDANSTIV